MGRINVVLPDGTVTSADEDEARKAGLPLETPTEADARGVAAATEERYSGAGQTFLAGLEGALSTATLGISDFVLDDPSTRARANVHGTARAIGSLAGAAVPFLPGPLGAVGRATPAGLAVRGGEGLAAATGAAQGTVRGLATAAGFEGALQGVGGEIARAELSGDPLTVESVLASAGHGAVMGAAAGGAAGVIMRGVQRARVARDAGIAVEASRTASKNAKLALDEAEELFTPVKVEVKALREQLSKAGGAKEFLDAIRQESVVADNAMRNVGLRGTTRGMSPDLAPDFTTDKAWRAAEKDALDYMSEVERAVRAKDTTRALNAHKSHIATVNRATELAGMPQRLMPVNLADPAVIRGTHEALKSFPATAKGFAAMHPDRVADLVNTLRGSPTQQAVRALDSLGKMAEKMGLKADDPVKAAVGLQEQMRNMRSAVRSTPATAERSERRGLLDMIKQRAAMKVGAGALGWTVGVPVGAVVAMEAGSAKAWMSNRLNSLVLTAGQPTATALRRLGPVTDRLRESITGGKDDEPSMEKVVANRMQEIRAAGVTARDLGYQVASPFAADHPEFALGFANALATGLEYLSSRLPKDPGTAMYMGRSDWKPSEGQVEELAAIYEAVKAPLDAIERMFSGDVDPSAAGALWAAWPNLMQEAQVNLIMNMDQLQDVPYPTVIGLSTAFQVPLDGLLLPQNVAFFQNFPSAQAQLPQPAQGSSNPGGRPPAVGTSNTRSSSPTQQTRTQQLLQ